MSLFTFTIFIDEDAAMDEIDDVHDLDVWISTIGVPKKFNCLPVGFVAILGDIPEFGIAVAIVLNFFCGVAFTGEIWFEKGIYLMVVSFPSPIGFEDSSFITLFIY